MEGKCQTLIFVTVKDMRDKYIKYAAPIPDTAITRPPSGKLLFKSQKLSALF